MHRYLPYDHGCEDPPHSYYLSEEFVQLLNGFSFVLIHLQKKNHWEIYNFEIYMQNTNGKVDLDSGQESVVDYYET